MSGTHIGGLKSAITIKKKYGEDYFKTKMGSVGGRASVPKGFASEKVDRNGLTGPQRAKVYGSVAGQISRRKPKEGGKNALGNKTKKQRSYK